MSAVRFAIIGCGLIGKKRAACLPAGSLAVVCDLDRGRAESLAATVPGCRAVTDPAEVFKSADVDAVIVSTVNSALSPLTGDAIRASKHVLVEKPGAFLADEAEALRVLAEEKRVIVRVGYNHRFHPALQKARELADSGVARAADVSPRALRARRTGRATTANGAPIRSSPAAANSSTRACI